MPSTSRIKVLQKRDKIFFFYTYMVIFFQKKKYLCGKKTKFITYGKKTMLSDIDD